MSISIKQLNNSFSAEVVDIILPIQQIEFNVPVTLADQPDLIEIEEFYLNGGGNFWGGIVEGRLTGTIALMRFSSEAGAVRKMFVLKEFRGAEFRIASLLLWELIDYSKSEGIKDLFLGTIDVFKAAIRFYEKNGFVLVHKEELPVDFPIMECDNAFYHLAL